VFVVVRQLANLFLTLGTAVDSAVAPERKLAYLALVTATDERQTAAPQQDSMMADATIVEEPPKMEIVDTPDAMTESVLGKRTNDEREFAERLDAGCERHTPSTEPSEPRPIKAIPMSRSGSRSLSAEPIEGAAEPALASPTRPLLNLIEETQKDGPMPMDVDESALDATTSTVDPALIPLPGQSLQAPPLPPRPHRASINNDMMFGKSPDTMA